PYRDARRRSEGPPGDESPCSAGFDPYAKDATMHSRWHSVTRKAGMPARDARGSRPQVCIVSSVAIAPVRACLIESAPEVEATRFGLRTCAGLDDPGCGQYCCHLAVTRR